MSHLSLSSGSGLQSRRWGAWNCRHCLLYGNFVYMGRSETGRGEVGTFFPLRNWQRKTHHTSVTRTIFPIALPVISDFRNIVPRASPSKDRASWSLHVVVTGPWACRPPACFSFLGVVGEEGWQNSGEWSLITKVYATGWKTGSISGRHYQEWLS